MGFLKRLVARFKRPKRPRVGRQPDASVRPTALIAIMAARVLLHDQIGQAANNGMVPDALLLSVLANHEAERAETRRLLVEEEAGFQSCLARVAATFPEPPLALPEPPPAPPPRHFPRLGKLLSQKNSNQLH